MFEANSRSILGERTVHGTQMLCSVADPDLESGAFLTPGSGMGRKSASRAGIRDEQSGSYFPELWNHFFVFFLVKILKFFDVDPGSGMETVRIRDPGWKKVGFGIRDKHPGSATLVIACKILKFVAAAYPGFLCAGSTSWKEKTWAVFVPSSLSIRPGNTCLTRCQIWKKNFYTKMRDNFSCTSMNFIQDPCEASSA